MPPGWCWSVASSQSSRWWSHPYHKDIGAAFEISMRHQSAPKPCCGLAEPGARGSSIERIPRYPWTRRGTCATDCAQKLHAAKALARASRLDLTQRTSLQAQNLLIAIIKSCQTGSSRAPASELTLWCVQPDSSKLLVLIARSRFPPPCKSLRLPHLTALQRCRTRPSRAAFSCRQHGQDAKLW